MKLVANCYTPFTLLTISQILYFMVIQINGSSFIHIHIHKGSVFLYSLNSIQCENSVTTDILNLCYMMVNNESDKFLFTVTVKCGK